MHGCLRREQSGSSCEPAWWGCPEHAGQGGGPHALARQRKSAPKALRFIQGISKNKKPFKGGGGLLKGHVIGAIYIYIFLHWVPKICFFPSPFSRRLLFHLP